MNKNAINSLVVVLAVLRAVSGNEVVVAGKATDGTGARGQSLALLFTFITQVHHRQLRDWLHGTEKKKKTAGSQTGDHLMKYNPKLDKVKKDICWKESPLAENSTSSLHVY